MSITGGLHIKLSDGCDPVIIRFTLVDSDVVLLEKFLDVSKTLFRSLDSIGGFNVIQTTSIHDLMRKHLRGIRDMYTGKKLANFLKVSYGDFVLNSENGFKTWINGFEYHRDREKVESIFSPGDMLTIEHLRPDFLLMVSAKINAIKLLSYIVDRMLETPEQSSGTL